MVGRNDRAVIVGRNPVATFFNDTDGFRFQFFRSADGMDITQAAICIHNKFNDHGSLDFVFDCYRGIIHSFSKVL